MCHAIDGLVPITTERQKGQRKSVPIRHDCGVRQRTPPRHLSDPPIRALSLAGLTVKKIAVFADVQNIYYTTRQAYGRQFNYRKLWQRLCGEGVIVSAIAYATDRGSDSQRKFQNALKKIGFTVKLKPYIQRSDGSSKGDWDVGITIDVIEAAGKVDTIVLLSGDGDFDLLVKKIREDFPIRAEVYGVPGLTARALIRSASAFYRIKEDLLL